MLYMDLNMNFNHSPKVKVSIRTWYGTKSAVHSVLHFFFILTWRSWTRTLTLQIKMKHNNDMNVLNFNIFNSNVPIVLTGVP